MDCMEGKFDEKERKWGMLKWLNEGKGVLIWNLGRGQEALADKGRRSEVRRKGPVLKSERRAQREERRGQKRPSLIAQSFAPSSRAAVALLWSDPAD